MMKDHGAEGNGSNTVRAAGEPAAGSALGTDTAPIERPGAVSGAAALDAQVVQPRKQRRGGGLWKIALFLLPALFLLGALVVYPIIFTVVRSFYNATGSRFVGLGNYHDMFTSPDTLTAIKNNVIWVLIAPAVVTALGLVFAVLTERVRWSTAFKVAVFVPMAIAFLSSGVIWRLVYLESPKIGLANATLVGISKIFRPPGPYPTARPAQPALLVQDGQAYVTRMSFVPNSTTKIGLVAIPPRLIPGAAVQAVPAPTAPGAISGTVWVDFAPGGRGTRGTIDPGERGLPGMKVQVLNSAGTVVKAATTVDNGTFAIKGLGPGSYRVGLADSNFRPAWDGILWLGPTLITPSIIISYIWIWAGFAMVLIAAGLAAIPRDVLEAARVDGASEWQVFRRITGPLLAPLLLVVLVTLLINVLKIFDLILIIPPGSVQADANVIALEMWRVSFGGGLNQGLGSALAVLLFFLVLPAMAFNLRRFRSEE